MTYDADPLSVLGPPRTDTTGEDKWAAAYLNRADVQAAIHAKKPSENGGRWADCSNAVFYYFSQEDRHSFMQPIYNYLLCVFLLDLVLILRCVPCVIPLTHSTASHRDDKKALGLRIMVFSGDDDSVCATQGTGLWIDRQPWTVQDGQQWMAWYVCLCMDAAIHVSIAPATDWRTSTNNHDATNRGLGQQVAGYIQGYTNGFTFATVHGAGHEVRCVISALVVCNKSRASRTHDSRASRSLFDQCRSPRIAPRLRSLSSPPTSTTPFGSRHSKRVCLYMPGRQQGCTGPTCRLPAYLPVCMI